MFLALENGHADCVHAIAESWPKYKTEEEIEYGYTPLHWAVYRTDVDCVAALLKAKACPNAALADGSAPLHTAVEKNSPECVKALTWARANVNASNEYGDTPLHRAAYYGQLACLELLIRGKADVN